MYARDHDDLIRLMAEHPGDSPSTFLADDSLAAWCYDRLTLRDLLAAFDRDADPDTCRRWRLSALAYKEQVAMAIAARRAADRHP